MPFDAAFHSDSGFVTSWVAFSDCDYRAVESDQARLEERELKIRTELFPPSRLHLELWSDASGEILKILIYHRDD